MESNLLYRWRQIAALVSRPGVVAAFILIVLLQLATARPSHATSARILITAKKSRPGTS